jgi:hypothetical protein
MEKKPMIACLLEKRAGDFTGLAHIVFERTNGEKPGTMVTAPITAKNLRKHIEDCAVVLVKLEQMKEE